jgi:hypothetical protein
LNRKERTDPKVKNPAQRITPPRVPSGLPVDGWSVIVK